MKRKVLFIAFYLLTCLISLQAEKKFITTGSNTLGTGMSPNGKYVVGVNPSTLAYNTYMESFLYNVETEKLEWITAYDETDYGKSGSFAEVSDNGVIAGTFKDPDYTLTVTDIDGDRTFPINMAAVWKDGIRTSLGFGNFEFSQFGYFEDGSFAEAISGDGKIIAGYIGINNATYMFPCVWKQTATDGTWTFSQLSLPKNAVGGKTTDVSADGNIIAGVVWYETYEMAAYWQNGECHLIKGIGDDTQYNNEFQYNKAHSVSPNGKYIAFTFSNKKPYVYDVELQTYKKIKSFDTVQSVDELSIANNGNIVSAYGYGSLMMGEIYKRPFWYFYDSDRMLSFDYVMNLFAAGVEPPFTFHFEEKTQVVPCAISADGTFVMGNNDLMVALGKTPECWMLQTENRITVIPESPEGLQAKSLNLKEVTLTWNKDKRTYEGLTLESFNIYSGGEQIANVPATDAETLTYVQTNAKPGFPEYTVTSVFKTTESIVVESPKTDPVTVAVPDTYSLPFYDDFDSGALETNYWVRQPQYGDMGDSNWGVVPYIGFVGQSLYSSATAQMPYSAVLISRPLDATGKKNVSLSFVISYALINSNDQQLDKDSLSIDVSMDRGANWQEVKGISIKDFSQMWSIQTIDLSQWVAGKLFQLRLRKHGQGVAQYSYVIDLLKVGTEPEKPAPEGLTGQITAEKQVDLIWKNPFNAYQLNHINDYYSHGLAIGNEGKEIIAANSFDAKDLNIYKGKYLTSVTAFINHNDYPDSKDTHAAIIIFKDGELISEKEMKEIEYNAYNNVVLDEPILIDGIKELKVGLKIYDYDERQLPITYQNTYNFLPGKSDLYSENGGKTWQKLSDFFAAVEGKELDGYCCWDITANITDERSVADPDIFFDDNMMAYNVFRNGEKLNNEMLDRFQSKYTDTEAIDNCYYEVVAYYFDGSVSEVSNRYTIEDPRSVRDKDGDTGIQVYPNPATDYINISGDFNQATLVNVDGQVILTTTENTIYVSGLSAGVYFLKIESANNTHTEKMMIKR